MCGIAGVFSQYPLAQADAICTLLQKRLHHRGPDATGCFVNSQKTICLVHTRLSILDLSEAGKQPMFDSAARYGIVFNGEIYNYRELRAEFASDGYRFRSATDTEVILAAYEKWGISCLEKFNGMFAFALVDTQTNMVYLARDRFGVKPLYYSNRKNILSFASEIQAIHALLGRVSSLEHEVMVNICQGRMNWQSTDQTYLQDVNSVPAGSYLAFNYLNQEYTINQWYSLQQREVASTLKQQAEEFLSILTDACTLRLRSDVPIATCLSGGLDSGTITALVNKYCRENLNVPVKYKSFCASFPGTATDELAAAQKLAFEVGSELSGVKLLSPSYHDLTTAMKACDGPMASLAFYPIWKLFGTIRENSIKVTLDGQGPDEALGGYGAHADLFLSALEQKDFGRFLSLFRAYAGQGRSAHYNSFRHSLNCAANAISRSFKRNLAGATAIGNDLKYPDFLKTREEKFLYYQFFCSPLPALFQQYDRCSMAHGVECRMPFLDYRLVELIFSLPQKSKIGGGFTKRILREATKNIVPDSTRLNRKKIGFNAPIVEWLRGPLKEFLLETYSGIDGNSLTYANVPVIKDSFEIFLKSPHPQWDTAWMFWPVSHCIWWLNHIKTDIPEKSILIQ